MICSKKKLAGLVAATLFAMQFGIVTPVDAADMPVVTASEAQTAKPEAQDKFKAPELALKVDRYDIAQLPRNFRSCNSEYDKNTTRDGVMPTRKGLDDERFSASSCFSEKELQEVIKKLGIKPSQFYDVDLRAESHGYFDGMAVSWFAKKDWGNDGLERDWDLIKHKETDQLNNAFHKQPITVYTFKDSGNKVKEPIGIRAKKVRTEEQMVKDNGANYIRLAIADHFRPDDEVVDIYLKWFKSLPKDAWVHYHCYAGMGRTTIFSVMHDILKSAPLGVSFDDIIERQGLIGHVFLNDIKDSKKNWGRALYIERYRFTEQFYDYVVHHPNLDYSYVKWAKEHHYYSGGQDYSGVVWRLEGKMQDALPRNFRTSYNTKLRTEIKKKYKPFVTSMTPSLKGLAETNMSGSAEFTIPEGKAMVAEIKKFAKGPIYDVDLRQEPHGYFDGQAVNWYGLRDWANVHFNDDSAAIIQDEKDRLKAAEKADGVVVAKVDASKARFDKVAIDPKTIKVHKAQTEEEVAKSLGMNYYRITARDHLWPAPKYVDQFVGWYKTLPKDAWLHFHCAAGAGRTTVFMVMVDMMKNPNIPLNTILDRQYLIGGNYSAYTIAHPKAKDYKAGYYADKARMIKWFYKYVRENKDSNYAVPWSKWIAEHDIVK